MNINFVKSGLVQSGKIDEAVHRIGDPIAYLCENPAVVFEYPNEALQFGIVLNLRKSFALFKKLLHFRYERSEVLAVLLSAPIGLLIS